MVKKSWEDGSKEKELAKEIKDKIAGTLVDNKLPTKGSKYGKQNIDSLDMNGLEAMKKELQGLGIMEKVSLVQNDMEAKIFTNNFQNVNF